MNNKVALAAAALWIVAHPLCAQSPTTESDLLVKLKGITEVEPEPAPSAPSTPAKVTEITATQEASFDNAKQVAVFLGNVRVTDPQFKLTCKKLTAYLKKAAPATTAAASPAPADSAEPADSGGGGLRSAVAEGSVVIVQEKPDAEGGGVTRYVGRSDRAEYDAVTGNMRLIGSPQVQEGINLHIATDPSTVMVLRRDGRTMNTIGPSRTIISEKPVENPSPRQ